MRWEKIFLIARYEFFRRILDPVFYIQIVIPFGALMLLALLFGLILAEAMETRELPVGFVDHSGLLSVLPLEEKENGDFLIYSSMEEAQAALRDHRLRALVEIPPDYLESGQILIWVSGTFPWPSTVSAFDQSASLLRKAIVQNRLDPQIARRVIEPIDQLRIIRANQIEGVQTPLIQTGARYVLVALLLLNISISVLYGYEDISRDRKNRVGELMLSTVSPTEWFAGKVFGVVLSVLMQNLIMIIPVLGILGGVSWQLLGDRALFSPKEVGLALVYCVLGMLFYISASMFTIVVHPKAAPVLLTMLGLLNPVILAVTIAPSSRIAVFLSFFPLTAPGTMLVRVLLGSAPWHHVVISLMELGVCLMGMIKAGSVMASRALIPGMPMLSIPRIRRRR